jgi:NAD(P)-dependent dehydrogenase (short-subunit alcohol dehydrogenase family)
MTGWLNGRVALVTGGGSGIGRAVARRFVTEGAAVGVLERDADGLDDLKAELGDRLVVVKGDVTSSADNQRAVQETTAAFGRLDSFIGNAGIWDYMMPLEHTPPEMLEAVFAEPFAINVKGYMLGARAALSELRKTKGNMVFTVSNSGFYPGGGGVIYTASKFAVVGLIKQLAFELAPDIRVNGVAPGATVTNLRGSVAAGQNEMIVSRFPGVEEQMARFAPLNIACRPEDHAAHYVLLASNESSRATTATIIQSDGGIEIRGLGSANTPDPPRVV